MPLLDSKHETEEFVKLLDSGFYRDDMKEERRMSELKPCPFCGGAARLREYRTFNERIHGMVNKYYIQCAVCRIEVPTLGYESDREAIKAWNRRVSAEQCQPGRAVDVWEKEVDEG